MMGFSITLGSTADYSNINRCNKGSISNAVCSIMIQAWAPSHELVAVFTSKLPKAHAQAKAVVSNDTRVVQCSQVSNSEQ